ncbi:hypothetical protein Tsubulata_042078 [Turnera subulata]|uniref:SBP-type domain-containing protein n=1 Tax=Turnera subulata TaxID=218843 RepID=A0A9Q0GI68_9ROSI|nr:hypothetical protein Tsubulata_042078 [Turnera subulata]
MAEKGKQVRILMGSVVKRETGIYGDSSDDGGSEMGYVEYDAHDHNQVNKKKRVEASTGGGGIIRKGPLPVGGGGGGGGGGGMKGCQAEKCEADLSDSKPYHKRHRVCEHHSKAQVVVVGGIRQRFCQQCSRFHELSEFDEAKRSCRRRLAGHNERRRKNAGESQADGSGGRRGAAAAGTHLKDIVCGQIDDRGRIKITIQENATYKHFEIR